MVKYYTRACNFTYNFQKNIKPKNAYQLSLHSNKCIYFDSLEVITRKSKKIIKLKEIRKIKNKILKKKILSDLKKITKKKKFKNLKFKKFPLIMGVINLTPDSFSDGGKYNKTNSAFKHAKYLIKSGCDILDIGGESTRPGASDINPLKEWHRIQRPLKKISKLKKYISIDTRKDFVMKKAKNIKLDLVNDVSGLSYSKNTIDFIKKTKIPFVLHHMEGTPSNMQNRPKYKNVLLDIYDFFEKKIIEIRKKGIYHDNIILDPGIGFGKNLKHNITILKNISIFHSLGFPLLLGVSKKKFIKDIAGVNDSKYKIGGTISSCLYLTMQGVQILRVHDVNEINQSIKVFKNLIN